MSLKQVPFESLDAVSYSPSIVIVAVSVAVCDIFNVKEWCDLENRVTVRSRSLEIAPFSSYLALNIHYLQRSLKVIQTGTIRKLGCGFLFAFCSNCGRICSSL